MAKRPLVVIVDADNAGQLKSPIVVGSTEIQAVGTYCIEGLNIFVIPSIQSEINELQSLFTGVTRYLELLTKADVTEAVQIIDSIRKVLESSSTRMFSILDKPEAQ